MQIAAIDIGTNSLHMIIARTGADGSFEIVGREKDMVRLGAGGLDGRPLGEPTMTAALQTLTRFKRLADSRAVDEVVAVATSAVREAPNAGDFLRTVERQTGIRARIISGLEEARLIHRAAVHAVDIGTGTAVVIDIGGGSTEAAVGTAEGAQDARSFHLGVIRLSERFVQSDPLSDQDERRLVRHVNRELGDGLEQLARKGFDRVIGTSGTILSLGALALAGGGGPVPTDLQLHHSRVTARALHKLRQDIVGLPLADRLRLPGLDSRRADLVVSGAILLDAVLRQLRATEITLCDVSLREGVVLDYIDRHRPDIERIERYPDIRRRSVIELAQRCHYTADHAQHVAGLALSLFDQTRAVHLLDARAREWLELASLLHDVGEHISYENHHRHSYLPHQERRSSRLRARRDRRDRLDREVPPAGHAQEDAPRDRLAPAGSPRRRPLARRHAQGGRESRPHALPGRRRRGAAAAGPGTAASPVGARRRGARGLGGSAKHRGPGGSARGPVRIEIDHGPRPRAAPNRSKRSGPARRPGTGRPPARRRVR